MTPLSILYAAFACVALSQQPQETPQPPPAPPRMPEAAQSPTPPRPPLPPPRRADDRLRDQDKNIDRGFGEDKQQNQNNPPAGAPKPRP